MVKMGQLVQSDTIIGADDRILVRALFQPSIESHGKGTGSLATGWQWKPRGDGDGQPVIPAGLQGGN